MMTLRNLAISSLVFSALFANLLVVASTERFHFYETLLKRATTICGQAAKAPIDVSEADPNSSVATLGPAVSLRIFSKSGKLLRISYFSAGTLIAVDQLGAGAAVVRRDIYWAKRIRVREFFDEENNLSQIVFLDTQGRVIHRKEPSVTAPLPGGVYG